MGFARDGERGKNGSRRFRNKHGGERSSGSEAAKHGDPCLLLATIPALQNMGKVAGRSPATASSMACALR
jgi:hypothetical protein